MFTGEQGDLAIQDYSANKEKRYKVIHPQIVKEYAHLNSISKIAKDDNIVCFEKKWFPGYDAKAEEGARGIIDMQLPEWSHKLLHPVAIDDFE